MCFLSKIILTDSNLFFFLYAFLGNPQLLIITLLVDVKTEEEYVLAKGTYGMGMDLKGDIKGALKNALKSIPNK